MRALALLGPRALKKHLEEFRSEKAELTFLDSPSPDILRRSLESRPDIVLIFGGDGTLNRHLGPLVESGIATIVVPTGSGNDFARATHTPTLADAKKVWHGFLNGSAKIIDADLGCITNGSDATPRYFSCCANVGLDADAARRADGFPNWVKQNGGYFLGGLIAMACYQPLAMQISGTGFPEIDEAGWFVSISNTPTYGGGLKIAPQASINDGQLDITFASKNNFARSELVRHFPKILAGDHIKLPQLTILRTSQISVHGAQPMPIYADGELMGETPCQIAIQPNALKSVQLL